MNEVTRSHVLVRKLSSHLLQPAKNSNKRRRSLAKIEHDLKNRKSDYRTEAVVRGSVTVALLIIAAVVVLFGFVVAFGAPYVPGFT